jgi:hypothetical protein
LWTAIGAAVAAVLAMTVSFGPAAGASGPAVAATSSPAALTPPQDDPFYQPPAGFAAAAPGTILRSRPVSLALFATVPVKLAAWQLLYRTTDYAGRPEATVTTVLLPAGGKARGLVSYQVAEDASAPQCAPSYELRPGGAPGEVINQAESLLIDAAAAEGFAVSVPDYEGPDGDFGAPRQPGYAVLDGLRAAEQFGPLGLDGAGTPVGIWGYSGGSLASGWAAQVQPAYAPDLDVRGVAVGGFVTDVGAALLKINGGFGAGLIASALPGVLRTSPALKAAFDSYATPAGQAALAQGGSQCEIRNVTQFAFANLSKYLTIPLARFLALPAVQTALAGLNLGGSSPTAPLFVYHAVNDELIPIAGTDATVKNYCAHGDSVTYTRDLASEHAILAVTGAPAALHWLTQRLTGGAVPQGCHTSTVLSMLLTAPGLAGLPGFLLGNITALLGRPIGTF